MLRSLWDELHLEEKSSQEATPVEWPDHMDGKQFAELIVHSADFRDYILKGLRQRDLPQGIVVRLMEHAWGKPTEHIDINDHRVEIEQMTKSELVQRIASMQELLEQLPDDEPAGSIH